LFYFASEQAEMKKQDNKKKVWVKPVVQLIQIKKDTFGGSATGAEDALAHPPTGPWGG